MKEIWFITGSQHLYGEETLRSVSRNSVQIVTGLNESSYIPVQIICKEIVTTPDSITKLFLEANSNQNCIGIIAWMHTFSPAKMWIAGLNYLKKPLCHLHTQFNTEIPWNSIDMDFMNLNQSAHGDREFGFIMSRMRINRKIVVGHWQEAAVQQKLDVWSRVALGWNEMQHLKVARIGDNMREVAVTEGDKVEAQIRFGFSVNGYDTTDITKRLKSIGDQEVKDLMDIYESSYELSASLKKGGSHRSSLEEAAKIELAIKGFLSEGGFGAFTDTFENLGAFRQLPGLAVQRLMAEGYGFGAEGDWKTAALLRVMKVMNQGLKGGTSFMEDYTYHFNSEKSYVLGSHMLEI
ncbi:MAG: L-arabinose isomerase, partial [Cyclobacteriaceae bacterium]|nr:L-arabinose isomerase [Cyclobacteriaceae bacterium]